MSCFASQVRARAMWPGWLASLSRSDATYWQNSRRAARGGTWQAWGMLPSDTHLCQRHVRGRSWWRERCCGRVPVLKYICLHCFLWENRSCCWTVVFMRVIIISKWPDFCFHQLSEGCASLLPVWMDWDWAIELWSNSCIPAAHPKCMKDRFCWAGCWAGS